MTDSHKTFSLRNIVAKLYTLGCATLKILFLKFPLYTSCMKTPFIKCCTLFHLNLFTFQALERRVYIEIICTWEITQDRVEKFSVTLAE